MALRVLIVEDDPTSQFIADRLFKGEFNITCVPNGDDALIALENEKFDLVITDIKLEPNTMTGTELMKEIRTGKQGKDIKIIAVSSYSTPAETQQFLNEGFDRFISKPYSRETMGEAVKEIFDL